MNTSPPAEGPVAPSAPEPEIELGITAPMRAFLDSITPPRGASLGVLDRFRNGSAGSGFQNMPSLQGQFPETTQSLFGRALDGVTANSPLERFTLFTSGATIPPLSATPCTNHGDKADESPDSVCRDKATFSMIGGWAFDNPVASETEPWYKVPEFPKAPVP
jgi:hypothetical protein